MKIETTLQTTDGTRTPGENRGRVHSALDLGLKKRFLAKETNLNRRSSTSVAAALYPSCVASTSRASRPIPTDGRMDKGKESDGEGGKEWMQEGNHPPAATPSLSFLSSTRRLWRQQAISRSDLASLWDYQHQPCVRCPSI